MKIAFILPGIGRSGGVRNTVVDANHLLARGHEVRIFYYKEPKTARSMFRSLRNKLIYSGRYDWLEMFKGKGNTIGFREISECKFAREEIIVGVGMWCSSELGRLNFIHNPKLQYLRGMTPWMPRTMSYALSLDLPKVVLSSHDLKYVQSRYGGKVLAVIPNAINPDEYYPAYDGNEQNGVGTICSRHPAKDPDTILAFLTALRDKFPDIPQHIFGTCPRPKEIPKTNYVRFPSVQKERQIYSNCKVWVLASCSEGFGVPILEAMACGCAVVATDCGGPRDIIVDGNNGFLVEVGDVDGILNRVERLLNDPILWEKFVENSQETVKKFSWEKSISKLEQVLLRVSKQY